MVAALKGLALGVVLIALYVGHIQTAAFVYEDARLVQGLDRPFMAGGLLRGRGLTYESWTVIRTPQAAHALNVGLHAGVVALTWLLLWQITGTAWMAWAGAAIVAVHPVTVEAVAYAASRSELFAALGVLGALTAATAGGAWWLLVPVAALVAWTGKESAVVGLALWPLVLWTRRDARLGDVCWALIGGAIIFSAIWWPVLGRMASIGESPTVSVTAIPWALAQAEAVWRLVVLSVAPFWLSVVPSVTGETAIGIGAVVLLMGLIECAWRARHIAPMVTFGIVWVVLVAAPRLLVRTPGSAFNEHQWYLALPGVASVLVALIDLTCRRAWRPAVEAA